MLTTDVLREVWSSIVGSHKAGLTFILQTNAVKDEVHSADYPVCRWLLPTCGQVQEAQILRDTYAVSMMFLEQTASDRPTIEMDRAHDRMAGVAKQCFTRFFDLYITRDESEWQGVELSLQMVGSATYTPVYDSTGKMLTGVGLSVTVQDLAPIECVDTYFNG